MPATQTFTVDAAGSPEEVKLISNARFVVIRQNDLDNAVLNFNIRAPFVTSGPVLYPAGKSVVIDLGRYMPPNSTVCFMDTVSGSDTFSAEES